MAIAFSIVAILACVAIVTVMVTCFEAGNVDEYGEGRAASIRLDKRAARIVLACAVLAVLAVAVATFAPLAMASHQAPATHKASHKATCVYVPAEKVIGPYGTHTQVTPCVAYVPQVPQALWQYQPMCNMYLEDTPVATVMLDCTYTTAVGHMVKYPDGVARWTYTLYVYYADVYGANTIHYDTTNDAAYNASQVQ